MDSEYDIDAAKRDLEALHRTMVDYVTATTGSPLIQLPRIAGGCFDRLRAFLASLDIRKPL